MDVRNKPSVLSSARQEIEKILGFEMSMDNIIRAINKDAKENGIEFVIKLLIVFAIANLLVGNIGLIVIISFLFFSYYFSREKFAETEESKVDETNQYLNFDIYDIGEEEPAIAFNSDPEKMNNNMELKTHVDHFLDMDAVYEKKMAQRQFHTITHNKYDSRKEFENAVCKPKNNCKTNQLDCSKWPDDIRGCATADSQLY